MIQSALKYITKELVYGIGLDISEVNLNRLQKIHEKKEQGLVVSLLNVEEESKLKNTPHYIRKQNQILYKQPPVFLNLNVILAFEFEHYGRSLQVMAETVNFFQNKKSFSADNERAENVFPVKLQKLILDLQPLSFEQINHIWSVSGGPFCPSLLYKIRLVKIQSEEEIEGPEINAIQLNSGLEEV